MGTVPHMRSALFYAFAACLPRNILFGRQKIRPFELNRACFVAQLNCGICGQSKVLCIVVQKKNVVERFL